MTLNRRHKRSSLSAKNISKRQLTYDAHQVVPGQVRDTFSGGLGGSSNLLFPKLVPPAQLNQLIKSPVRSSHSIATSISRVLRDNLRSESGDKLNLPIILFHSYIRDGDQVSSLSFPLVGLLCTLYMPCR